jgi:hypothetical protein
MLAAGPVIQARSSKLSRSNTTSNGSVYTNKRLSIISGGMLPKCRPCHAHMSRFSMGYLLEGSPLNVGRATV